MTATTEVNVTNLQDRVVKILTTPKTEWPVIEAESTDVATLYKSYIAILAAIPAVCSFIGGIVIGVPVPFFGTVRTPIGSAITTLILTYVLSLASVYIAAFVIDKLAPTFDSKPNVVQALKLVAYSSTAGWVAGVLNIIPVLGIIAALAGLYGIYLFYLGLPVLMKTPEAKVIPYMVVAAIVVIVLSILVGVIVGMVVGAGAVATSL
jgi:Yip1 domain